MRANSALKFGWNEWTRTTDPHLIIASQGSLRAIGVRFARQQGGALTGRATFHRSVLTSFLILEECSQKLFAYLIKVGFSNLVNST